MPRTLLFCAVLAALPLTARAEPQPAATETVIRLSVQPMPVPKPTLRYVLLPELREMNPGNPIQSYLRCFAEQQNFFFKKESCDRRDQLLAMPLRDLPAQEVQDYGRHALRQADWAARLDKPDWQILPQLKRDGINLLIPDVQQMRMLANALKVRFRGEVAAHRFDDACRTAKTLFAMSRHLSEHPTFIGDLVGIAIAYVALGPLEEMLEQPGCPNLYWALTYLPTPLVPLDKGAEGERVWIEPEFRDLSETSPMSAEQLKKAIAHFDQLLKLAASEGQPVKSAMQAWLDARTKDEAVVRAARRNLIDHGLTEELVQRFPAEQVLLLEQKQLCAARQDEVLKLVHLPVWQVEVLDPHVRWKKEPILFDLSPAILKVRRAQGRLDQRIALLRHVEALRLYAAAHGGRLPEKLADVTEVPLPDDPFTGKPFHYHLDSTTAHLRGSSPRGEEKNPAFNIHYEISVQK
jgi:hypothetical protein